MVGSAYTHASKSMYITQHPILDTSLTGTALTPGVYNDPDLFKEGRAALHANKEANNNKFAKLYNWKALGRGAAYWASLGKDSSCWDFICHWFEECMKAPSLKGMEAAWGITKQW